MYQRRNQKHFPDMEEHYNDNDYNDQLDHCKLYVKNIPKNLSQDGLKTLFSKHGNCTKVFLSGDPTKRYALVTFETASEAKLAMMNLNKTEPFQLLINVAYKRPHHDSQNQRNNVRDTSYRDEEMSNGSRGRYSRKQDEVSNGDNNNLEEFLVDDDLAMDSGVDTQLVLEMEQLKLEHLKLQEAQLKCRQRMLLLNCKGENMVQKAATTRSILPDGRIVVQNNNDRLEHGDTYSSPSGDSLTLPALQRAQYRACLACGNTADSFCARCGLAPYCSPRCQQTDWVRRHRAVCHNLARLNKNKEKIPDKEVEVAVVPGPSPHDTNHNTKRYEKRNENNTPDRPSPALDRSNRNNTPQNKSHRTSSNFKNHNMRRPMQTKTNNEEESFEFKGTKPSEPEVKPEVKNEKAKEQINNLPSQKPAPVEPKTPTPDTAQEVKIAKPMTVSDATPVKRMIPKNYVAETLSLGDSVLLSVDSENDTGGFVCLSLNESNEQDYQLLCDDYSALCEADTEEYKPKPGELFSYCNPEDKAWYRARMLSATKVALIDSSKILEMSGGDKCRKITPQYENIPEFSCVLSGENVKIGDSLKGKLTSKTTDGYKVSLENAETGSAVGEGVVSRWRPRIERPVERQAKVAAPVKAVIPEVPRPDVVNNSTVLLVEASEADAVFVRPADGDSQRKYDAVLQDVLMYGMTAKPIEVPPQKGEVVIAKYTDGIHYRALCKRTNVSQNKYLLEFIEFGNTEINTKESISACPPELGLELQPTVVSRVKMDMTCSFTEAAKEYIEKLKDTGVEMLLTLSDGSKSAPSGAAVNLSLAKNKESVNKKVEDLSTPSWKKIEQNGGDVVLDSPRLLYSELEHLELPESGGVLDVLDVSILSGGAVTACLKDLPYATHVFTKLTEQMAEYCNSEIGREPYVPMLEELCIAKCPPYPQWFRGAVCSRGEGGALRVCFVDYGNVDDVPVDALRKMPPDFVRNQPALASHLEIEGFPKDPSDEILLKALTHLKVNDEGRGTLVVTKCEMIEPGFYRVHAPDLIKAIGL